MFCPDCDSLMNRTNGKRATCGRNFRLSVLIRLSLEAGFLIIAFVLVAVAIWFVLP